MYYKIMHIFIKYIILILVIFTYSCSENTKNVPIIGADMRTESVMR